MTVDFESIGITADDDEVLGRPIAAPVPRPKDDRAIRAVWQRPGTTGRKQPRDELGGSWPRHAHHTESTAAHGREQRGP